MSKTPLDTRRRDRKPVLLLDENISSPAFAVPLRALKEVWRVELVTDHLPRGASDADVVALCGRNGWTLNTCDEMRYHA